MSITSIRDVAENLNELAESHPIGELQAYRSSRNFPLFMLDSKAMTEHWAFHWGGRRELQFNIGVHDDYLRHGVAFSFEKSREYKFDDLVTILYPKVRRFNGFMRKHGRLYSDMKVWIWDPHVDDYVFEGEAQPFPLKLLKKDSFAFLGKVEHPLKHIDYEAILRDFDRLFHLYKYVEGGGNGKSPSERDIGSALAKGKARQTLPQPHYQRSENRSRT